MLSMEGQAAVKRGYMLRPNTRLFLYYIIHPSYVAPNISTDATSY